jgi:SAM-dependent methyltransferase
LPGQSGEYLLEFGTGGSLLKEFVPDLITSDVFDIPTVDAVIDGRRLPFPTGAMRAIAMTDVLHHLPQPKAFFAEAARCVRPGGVIAMIEPWVTPWSRLVYGRRHHEPFQPDGQGWTSPGSGPLSGSNSALPWIIFQRDRGQFERKFPKWQSVETVPFMPFRYLVSGGVSTPSLMPGWSHWFWRWLETWLTPWMVSLAMLAKIELLRTTLSHPRPISQAARFKGG